MYELLLIIIITILNLLPCLSLRVSINAVLKPTPGPSRPKSLVARLRPEMESRLPTTEELVTLPSDLEPSENDLELDV